MQTNILEVHWVFYETRSLLWLRPLKKLWFIFCFDINKLGIHEVAWEAELFNRNRVVLSALHMHLHTKNLYSSRLLHLVRDDCIQRKGYVNVSFEV